MNRGLDNKARMLSTLFSLGTSVVIALSGCATQQPRQVEAIRTEAPTVQTGPTETPGLPSNAESLKQTYQRADGNGRVELDCVANSKMNPKIQCHVFTFDSKNPVLRADVSPAHICPLAELLATAMRNNKKAEGSMNLIPGDTSSSVATLTMVQADGLSGFCGRWTDVEGPTPPAGTPPGVTG